MTTVSTPTEHSRIVGGSTAKRRLACLGSLRGEQRWPAPPTSPYAEVGTMLHNVMAKLLTDSKPDPDSYIGFTHVGEDGKSYVCTKEHIENKIRPALAALNEIDPNFGMELYVEQRVVFDPTLGAFGTCDILGKCPNKVVILDWKFGDGIIVDVEENEQAMYYAASALHTPELAPLFEGVKVVELIIVQPPMIKRWETTVERIKAFDAAMREAVRKGMQDNAPFTAGEHCKFCAGQEIDPKTGLTYCEHLRKPLLKLPELTVDEEAMEVQYEGKVFSAEQIGKAYRDWVQVIEPIGAAIERVVRRAVESGVDVPYVKLVPKRARRQWADVEQAANRLTDLLEHDVLVEQNSIADLFKPAELRTPAQVEKVLKKWKHELPDGLVVAVSSGDKLVLDPKKTLDQCNNGTLRDVLKAKQ